MTTLPAQKPCVPVVAVYNNLEVACNFLQRAGDPSFIETRRYRGDRALFWLGDPKLVFTTAPIPHAQTICHRWGYSDTRAVAPVRSTQQLSLDILREPALLDQLVAYAGLQRALQLVPYATTPEFLHLAEVLRTEHHLTVHLPESPAPDARWLRDYIGTKAGFHALVPTWIAGPNMLSTAVICTCLAQAVEVIAWFNARGQGCVVKSNDGESGIGHEVFPAVQPAVTPAATRERLDANPFLRNNVLVVERYVDATVHLSPSLELYVPPAGAGPPEVTYLSRQIFGAFGRFAGVMVSRTLLDAPWYPRLEESGLAIAAHLQALGYAGHFDLDTVIDDDGRLFLLEINARRTGGTHVHEFARHTLGADYIDQVTLLSDNGVDSAGIDDVDTLMHVLDDLLYPMQNAPRGVVITVTSALAYRRFGCIIAAPSDNEALHLKCEMLERLRHSASA